MHTNSKLSDVGLCGLCKLHNCLTVKKCKFINFCKFSVDCEACHLLFILLLSQKGSKYLMKLPFSSVCTRSGKSEKKPEHLPYVTPLPHSY